MRNLITKALKLPSLPKASAKLSSMGKISSVPKMSFKAPKIPKNKTPKSYSFSKLKMPTFPKTPKINIVHKILKRIKVK